MILVPGGTSWLGGEVARVALARGQGVTFLARGESGQAPPGATFVRADRGEDTAYEQVCDQDWDGVVDVSWQPGFVKGAVTALADRTGYWPMRFAHPAAEDGAVLVPDCPDLATQVIDVRDLAAWLVHCIEVRVHGTFNACGPVTRFADHLDAARRVASRTGRLVTVSDDWLAEDEADPWTGPRSLPLWLPNHAQLGFGGRSTEAEMQPGSSADPGANPRGRSRLGGRPSPGSPSSGP